MHQVSQFYIVASASDASFDAAAVHEQCSLSRSVDVGATAIYWDAGSVVPFKMDDLEFVIYTLFNELLLPN